MLYMPASTHLHCPHGRPKAVSLYPGLLGRLKVQSQPGYINGHPKMVTIKTTWI
jgi:hypothetical protein